MASKMNRLKKATVCAILALVFFGGLFFYGMGMPTIYFWLPAAGVLSSSVMAVFYWRKERKADARTSPVGIWILLGVILLFIVAYLLLPAL